MSQNAYHNDSTRALGSKAAAHRIGVSDPSLKLSRQTGLLLGVEAPKFRKLTRKVIYLVDDLDRWLNELPSYSSTAQIKGSGL